MRKLLLFVGALVLVVGGLVLVPRALEERDRRQSEELRRRWDETHPSPEPGSIPAPTPSPSPAATATGSGCVEHVELHGGAWWARELGKPEMWVLAHHQINMWENPSPTKGRRVGAMRVGSRAVILDKLADDYKVRSPLDGSIGWVGAVQVERTLFQDTVTRSPCRP